MEKSKKRAVVDEEEGKQHVEKLLKEENDAIKSFFYADLPATKAVKKSKKTKAPTVESQVDTRKNKDVSKKQELQLQVPANEPTPFSKELEKSGGGISINTFTGQVKKVTRGKNATKGRGVIAENRVATRQLPDSFDLASASRALHDDEVDTYQAAHDDKQEEFDVENNDDDALEEKDEDSNAPQFDEKTSDKTNTLIAAAHFDDGITAGRPIYTNDAWAETKVKTLQKQLHKQGKKVPDFFIRRNESPGDFIIDEQVIAPLPLADGGASIETNVDYALQKQVPQWYSVERRCKILTFNPDGDYKWPLSSPYNCWNCCHPFSGPPCMIPRHFNRTYRYYEVYGTFCSWSCAKRFASDTNQDYHSDTSPSIDFFAWKYFHVALPIPQLPPPFVLSTFSDFNMSIEEYRKIGQVHYVEKDGQVSPTMSDNYTIVHPPCVPYELIIMWEVKHPQAVQLKKGFDAKKKQAFENKMRGKTKIPDMPAPVVAEAKPTALSASKKAASGTGSAAGVKPAKRKRDLLSIFDQ